MAWRGEVGGRGDGSERRDLRDATAIAARLADRPWADGGQRGGGGLREQPFRQGHGQHGVNRQRRREVLEWEEMEGCWHRSMDLWSIQLRCFREVKSSTANRIISPM